MKRFTKLGGGGGVGGREGVALSPEEQDSIDSNHDKVL